MKVDLTNIEEVLLNIKSQLEVAKSTRKQACCSHLIEERSHDFYKAMAECEIALMRIDVAINELLSV